VVASGTEIHFADVPNRASRNVARLSIQHARHATPGKAVEQVWAASRLAASLCAGTPNGRCPNGGDWHAHCKCSPPENNRKSWPARCRHWQAFGKRCQKRVRSSLLPGPEGCPAAWIGLRLTVQARGLSFLGHPCLSRHCPNPRRLRLEITARTRYDTQCACQWLPDANPTRKRGILLMHLNTLGTPRLRVGLVCSSDSCRALRGRARIR